MDCKAVDYGFGKHADDLSHQQLRSAMKYFYISQPLYKVGICSTKLSILTLYSRVFTVAPFLRINLAVKVVVIVYSTVFLFLTIFQCMPVRKAWMKDDVPGTCISNMGQWFSFAIINIISDLVIIALPLPLIRRLHLPRGQKIGLSLLFGLGATVKATQWTAIELNVAIVCASLPALKAPFSRLFPRFLSSGPGFSSSQHSYPVDNGHGHNPYALNNSLKGSPTSQEHSTSHFSFSKVFWPAAERRERWPGVRTHIRTLSNGDGNGHKNRTGYGNAPSPFPIPDLGSEEMIVPRKSGSRPSSFSPEAGSRRDSVIENGHEYPRDGIVKTTVVSVQYEDQNGNGYEGDDGKETDV
ncbi:MAG: hypothetical protein M4579_000051 [Chaenotheca gracillima]|nr:MAG: hypothetical protein M4579_000051 [Chaenotheca gracillima]